MSFNKYYISIITFSLIASFFLTSSCFSLSGDVDNVEVNGYIYDSISKSPIEDAKILIRNDRFESDNGYINYDEYLGRDTVFVYSNSEGFYSALFKKSAYIYIRVFKKGYTLSESDGLHAKRKITQDFFLKNGESEEIDLYKNEIIEIVE